MVLTAVNYYYCALTVFAYKNNIDFILATVVYAYRKHFHYTSITHIIINYILL